MKIKNTLLLLLIIFSFASCRKTVNPSWEVGVYAPIFNTTMDFSDIAQEENSPIKTGEK